MNLAHDDDGIIDLRALKSTPPPPNAFAAFAMPSPFGSEPPPAAFARDADDDGDSDPAAVVSRRASKGKTIAIAAGAALFVVLGAVGVVFAFRGEKPAVVSAARAPITQAAPLAAAAAAPAPSAVAAAPATSASAAASAPAASSDNSSSASSDAPPAKKGKGAKARGGAAAASAKAKAGTIAASSSDRAKPAAAKAADPCHCHGDFQCNIRCSATR